MKSEAVAVAGASVLLVKGVEKDGVEETSQQALTSDH